MIKLEMKAKGTFPKELLTLFPQERNAKVRRRREDKVLVFTCKGSTKNIDSQTAEGLEHLIQVGFYINADWKNNTYNRSVSDLFAQVMAYETTKMILGLE